VPKLYVIHPVGCDEETTKYRHALVITLRAKPFVGASVL
jgi:hypothetical protein